MRSCVASVPTLHLQSFPTRRSSDLREPLVAERRQPHEPEAVVERLVEALLDEVPRERCDGGGVALRGLVAGPAGDRKSTRRNSSHVASSYAVFCLKKKRRRAQSARS